MSFDRREFLAASLAATGLACQRTMDQNAAAANTGAVSKLSMPGPYPGRVVSVHHPGSIIENQFQAEPVQQMIDRGMMELTHAEAPVEAWREFFEPGDVVGVKLNGAGRPYVISDAPVLHSIIRGLESAGVKRQDIVCYDRWKTAFDASGFESWLPEGVRWTYASPKGVRIQLDMDGYDRDVFMELPLVHPDYKSEYDLSDSHPRRSYVAKFLTQDVNKMINVPLLKHHQSAGVTLALKNMSHGLVNNVSRSHVTTTANACGIFIPAVVDLPVIREKCILHILDGVKGAYHGGPNAKVRDYTWAHNTMYFATDPVSLDKVGWQAIDEKRAEMGRAPVALLKPDKDSQWLNCQVEHIEIASNFGLGVFDDEKIRVKRIDLA